jgi:outer membrane protein assembly factor BamB
MHALGRWVALGIAALALIAPATAWSSDRPVLRIAVTPDAATSAAFADPGHVIVRGGFTEVGVPHGDVVIADRQGVREIPVGPLFDAAVLPDRFAFAVPGRLVLVDQHGHRRSVRAPWHGAFPFMLRCGPWLCFVAERGRGRLEIGAVDRTGRPRWRRRVSAGDLIRADAQTLLIGHGRRLARYARRDGRSRGMLTLPSRPFDVELGHGRIYVLVRRHARARVAAYTRAAGRRTATAGFALDEPTSEAHLVRTARGVALQGGLLRLTGEGDLDTLVLGSDLRVRRTLEPGGSLAWDGRRLVASSSALGTIQAFDPATGRAGTVRRVAMEQRGPLMTSGPAGTVVWGDYGSPSPTATEGVALVDVTTGTITARHLADRDTNAAPIVRAGGRTWTSIDGDLLAIDDEGHTFLPSVDFPVTALATDGPRVYAAVGDPQRIVALDAATGSVLPFTADTGCATCAALALVADAGIVAVTTIDTGSSAGAFAVRALDPADGHLRFQRPLPLFPLGAALGPDAIHIVGAPLDGKRTSSLEVTVGRDGAPRPDALRLAPFLDEGDDAPGAANDVTVIAGLGQVVVGDLQGRDAAAGACGAILTDLSGAQLRSWRPCLPQVPLRIAALGRRVAIGFDGGLEVYDVP